MKIAGSKNDGAWFRANKQIQALSGLDRVALGTLIAESPNSDAAFNAIIALAAESGVTTPPGAPESREDWVTSMLAHGIPRQIWNGRLSYTTYTLSGAVNERIATANYQSEMHYFARDLRRIVRKFIFARRAIFDLLDLPGLGTGNPGGLPDANVDT